MIHVYSFCIILTLVGLNYCDFNLKIFIQSMDKLADIHQRIVSVSTRNSSDNINYLNEAAIYKVGDDQLESFLTKLDLKPSLYVFEVVDINSLNDSLSCLLAQPNVYSSNSIIVILTENENLIQSIIDLLWNFKLLRSFIVRLGPRHVDVYTIKLIECGVNVSTDKVTDIEELVNEFDLNLKLTHCPVYVITGYEPPFVNQPGDKLPGIFLEVMAEFCKASKRKLVLRPYDPIYMEELVTSYNFQSMVADFESGYADIFLGAIQLTALEVLDLGPILLSNDLLFLVPRAFISGSVGLLFSPSIFRTIAVTSIAIVAIVFLFHYSVTFTVDRVIFTSLSKTLLIFFGIILNLPTLLKVPKSIIVRYFIVCVLLVMMIFTSYLQGVFISILNGPFYQPPIHTLLELLETEMPIKLFPTLAFFFQYTGSKYYKDIFDRHSSLNAPDMFESGEMLLKERNFATVIYRGFLIIRPNIDKSFSAFEFWSNTHTVAMPKNYYMHKEFFELFTRLLEHGVVAKYWKLYEFTYALKGFVDTESRVYRVTLEQFEPAIFVLLIGQSIALLVFLAELILARLLRFSFHR